MQENRMLNKVPISNYILWQNMYNQAYWNDRKVSHKIVYSFAATYPHLKSCFDWIVRIWRGSDLPTFQFFITVSAVKSSWRPRENWNEPILEVEDMAQVRHWKLTKATKFSYVEKVEIYIPSQRFTAIIKNIQTQSFIECSLLIFVRVFDYKWLPTYSAFNSHEFSAWGAYLSSQIRLSLACTIPVCGI